MTSQDRLRRSYLRLMWAYPRWYRRARGLELVTTLLDDAAPGQRRPRLVDVTNLVSGGLRTRLVPPRNVVAWAVALLVALSMALIASSAAILVSPYPGPPTEEQAITVAMIAMVQAPDNVPGPELTCDVGCPREDYSDGVVANDLPPMRTDHTDVYYNPPWPDAPTVVAQAQDRLAAAGWQVDPVGTTSWSSSTFTARSDHFNVLVWTQKDGPGASAVAPTIIINLSKRVSSMTVIGVAAASMVGLLVGWMIGVSVLHRYRRYSRSHQRATISVAMPFLAFAPLVLFFTASLAALDLADGISPEDIQAPLAFIGFLWPITVLSAISALFGLAALGFTALPDSTQDQPADPPYPAHPASG